jgi:hypothetical protein
MYVRIYVTKVMLESDYSSHLDLRQIDHKGDRGIKLDQDPMANFRANGFESHHSITNFHF